MKIETEDQLRFFLEANGLSFCLDFLPFPSYGVSVMLSPLPWWAWARRRQRGQIYQRLMMAVPWHWDLHLEEAESASEFHGAIQRRKTWEDAHAACKEGE